MTFVKSVIVLIEFFYWFSLYYIDILYWLIFWLIDLVSWLMFCRVLVDCIVRTVHVRTIPVRMEVPAVLSVASPCVSVHLIIQERPVISWSALQPSVKPTTARVRLAMGNVMWVFSLSNNYYYLSLKNIGIFISTPITKIGECSGEMVNIYAVCSELFRVILYPGINWLLSWLSVRRAAWNIISNLFTGGIAPTNLFI